VYLVVVLAALTASPLVALAICGFFGLVRGLAILLTARITTPVRLRAFHRRFTALAEPVRIAVIAVQLLVACIAAAAVWGVVAAAVSLVVVVVMVSMARRTSTRPVRDAGVAVAG